MAAAGPGELKEEGGRSADLVDAMVREGELEAVDEHVDGHGEAWGAWSVGGHWSR